MRNNQYNIKTCSYSPDYEIQNGSRCHGPSRANKLVVRARYQILYGSQEPYRGTFSKKVETPSCTLHDRPHPNRTLLMFSRILSSARNIVPFNKHDGAAENGKKSPGGRSITKQVAQKKSATPKSTMVTTRRQSNAALINPDDSNAPDELLSASAKKRRRTELSKKAAAEEDVDTPTKRRKLPVRNKGESAPEATQSHIDLEAPATELSEEPTAPTPTAKSKKTTPKSTPKGKRNAVVEDTEPATESAASTEQKEPAEAEVDDSKNNGVPAVVDTPVAKPKHKKFGDNDPIEVVAAPEPEAERIQEDEDESSDDDAPEEVGAQAAQSKAKGAARGAAKAAEQ